MVATDQAVKLLVRSGQFDVVRLGPFGSLRMAAGRLWLARSARSAPNTLGFWAVSAGALMIAAAALPSSHVFVGLLVGGSLSNVVESWLRGSVTDFVCLRFWPAFNVADVALAVGALGVGIELLRTVDAVTG
ncbi:signal peptidase II [Mycolicibacterium pulveris]|uniref:signal peptidase II n=1 Tax=Mycolicibacterium pulveris TaxID=36813 RepID=UPI003CEC29EB